MHPNGPLIELGFHLKILITSTKFRIPSPFFPRIIVTVSVPVSATIKDRANIVARYVHVVKARLQNIPVTKNNARTLECFLLLFQDVVLPPHLAFRKDIPTRVVIRVCICVCVVHTYRDRGFPLSRAFKRSTQLGKALRASSFIHAEHAACSSAFDPRSRKIKTDPRPGHIKWPASIEIARVSRIWVEEDQVVEMLRFF